MAPKLPTPDLESSLSPAPEGVVAQVESKAAAKTTANGTKRKIETSDVKVTTKRTKKTVTKSTAHDATLATDDSPRPKRHATNKAIIEEDVDEVKVEENGESGLKVTKKATTTRKKQVDLAPLAERTSDTNLRVGAHVSTAGG
jgi:AP endonuclease-1